MRFCAVSLTVSLNKFMIWQRKECIVVNNAAFSLCFLSGLKLVELNEIYHVIAMAKGVNLLRILNLPFQELITESKCQIYLCSIWLPEEILGWWGKSLCCWVATSVSRSWRHSNRNICSGCVTVLSGDIVWKDKVLGVCYREASTIGAPCRLLRPKSH